ncbi:SAM-dependent methyltransferase [Sporolactobacillus shoreicorticis]|uniref:SAM-dependent methyltransferase n=1 Tax=Sporolactobacillus shoreicorticis TaxID=1923877 RepID=A0ABW5S8C4_9BACL|nr:SAM-dependent methyltransferase [Sporolactobacillus shoreicorticis]MCO7126899.1 SAM-dependent methyltransferase [Sporolactobacillus shoreicorticis]
MNHFIVNQIGIVSIKDSGMFVELDKAYIPALKELDTFSHINVIWWFDGFDDTEMRSVLENPKPYKNLPDTMGIFATRSPLRPNPIALTTTQMLDIDHDNGSIQIAYIDADNNSPVLDIKPYTPSLDRIENPTVPAWCNHWPKSVEDSGTFDWSKEFNF